MRTLIKISSQKEYRKELWEIQGLLYLLVAQGTHNQMAANIIYLYGVLTLIFAIFFISNRGNK